MTREPIPGLSDQRYFHVALVSPRRSDFGPDWVWNALRKDCKVSSGRYKPEVFADLGLEFRTARAPAVYAGSGSREALAFADGVADCAYDVFAGSIKGIVIFGTGYAALTRLLVGRLVKRDLASKAWFLIPKMHELVDFCRASQAPDLPMKFTITGFSAFVPGVKNLKLIRLGGPDVFNSGLVEPIERWLRTRGRNDSEEIALKDRPVHSLQYQAVRLKAMGTLSGSTVSLSLAASGGCKMWLRKNAMNLQGFATALSTLKDLGEFETTTAVPDWSEDAGV